MSRITGDTEPYELRCKVLEYALALGQDKPEQVVEKAQVFYDFLTGTKYSDSVGTKYSNSDSEKES